jgi:CLIP-associating protein 1/2
MAEKITEEQVAKLQDLLRSDASTDAKVQQINNIKSGIKQNNVPEACIVPLFEAVRASMTSQHAVVVQPGFSTLNNLLARLSRQDSSKYVVKEAGRTLPLVIEKLGDPKEKYRALAATCLTTFWKAAPTEVEKTIKNAGLVGKNARMKEAAMQWIVQVRLSCYQYCGYDKYTDSSRCTS